MPPFPVFSTRVHHSMMKGFSGNRAYFLFEFVQFFIGQAPFFRFRLAFFQHLGLTLWGFGTGFLLPVEDNDHSYCSDNPIFMETIGRSGCLLMGMILILIDNDAIGLLCFAEKWQRQRGSVHLNFNFWWDKQTRIAASDNDFPNNGAADMGVFRLCDQKNRLDTASHDVV